MRQLFVALVIVVGIFLFKPVKANDIRLPNTSTPFNYDLRLHINVTKETYSGNVTIRLQVTQADVNSIVLNCHPDVTVADDVLVYFASDPNQVNIFSGIQRRASDQIVEFQTNSTLVLYAEYFIRINFSGSIRRDSKGLSITSYWTADGQRRYDID